MAPQLTIHTRQAPGTPHRLDELLELVAFVARPRPLDAVLQELPPRVARVLGCDGCAIYVLEGDSLLLHGQHGAAQDRVQVGAGVAGMALETLRPVSASGEGPSSLGLPVVGPYGPVGTLLLLRNDGAPFTAPDIELAAALTAPVSAVLERAHLIAALRGLPRGAAARSVATRRMTLPGTAITAGRALGPVCGLVRPDAGHAVAVAGDAAHVLDQAMSSVRRELDHLMRRATELGHDASFLDAFGLMLQDARLRERVLQLEREGEQLSRALTRAGSEATRAAERSREPFVVERARALHDLCEALAVLVTGEVTDMPRDAVLVGDQITVFDLLVSARRQPAAVVLTSPATPAMATLLVLVGVPAVVNVPGLFRWVCEGDLALVDGDQGEVKINPGRDDIASVRRARREAERG